MYPVWLKAELTEPGKIDLGCKISNIISFWFSEYYQSRVFPQKGFLNEGHSVSLLMEIIWKDVQIWG